MHGGRALGGAKKLIYPKAKKRPRGQNGFFFSTDLWTSVNALKRLHAILSRNAVCVVCLHCSRASGIWDGGMAML